MKNRNIVMRVSTAVILFFFIATLAQAQEKDADKFWEWEIGFETIKELLYSIATPEEATHIRDVSLNTADSFVRDIMVETKGDGRKKNLWFLLNISWKRIQYSSPSSALERLTWAWYLAPDNPNIYWAMGSALGIKEQLEESVILFEVAERLNKSTQIINVEGQSSRFDIDYSHSLINLWDKREMKDPSLLTRAENLLNKAKNNAKENGEDCCCLSAVYSVLLFNQGRYGESAQEYEHVKEDAPHCRNAGFEMELSEKKDSDQ